MRSPLLAILSIMILFEQSYASSSQQEVNMGTTIVALKTQTGVVLGADTRTSASTMVSNRYANKISFLYRDGPISCVLCRSGSAADTQYLADEARWAFRSRAQQIGKGSISVSQIARWLRYVVMNGNYGASLLCAGYDPLDGSRIYSIAPTGALLEESVFAASGSGSTYILGLMDTALKDHQKENNLLEEEEAIELVTKLVHAAVARDGSSGGVARIVVMNDQGSRELIRHPPPSFDSALTGEGGKELKGFQAATPPPKLQSFKSS